MPISEYLYVVFLGRAIGNALDLLALTCIVCFTTLLHSYSFYIVFKIVLRFYLTNIKLLPPVLCYHLMSIKMLAPCNIISNTKAILFLLPVRGKTLGRWLTTVFINSSILFL